jgi:hypothetical protein
VCHVGKTSQLIVLQETGEELHVYMSNLSTEESGDFIASLAAVTQGVECGHRALKPL